MGFLQTVDVDRGGRGSDDTVILVHDAAYWGLGTVNFVGRCGCMYVCKNNSSPLYLLLTAYQPCTGYRPRLVVGLAGYRSCALLFDCLLVSEDFSFITTLLGALLISFARAGPGHKCEQGKPSSRSGMTAGWDAGVSSEGFPDGRGWK